MPLQVRDAEAFAATAAELEAARNSLAHQLQGTRAELASAQQVLEAQGRGHAAAAQQLVRETREKGELRSRLGELEGTRAELRREIGESAAQSEQLQELLVTQEGEREALQRECDRLTQLLGAERGDAAHREVCIV